MTSASLPPRDDARQLENFLAEEIERLPGVVAAAITRGPGGEIHDVYLAATPTASAADLQQATVGILARNGVHVSSGVVRVGTIQEPLATTPEPAPAAPATEAHVEVPAWQGRFLLLESVRIETSGSHIACRVRLLRQGERLEGEARELDTDLGRVRAAARATIAAAEQASPFALGLEGAAFVDLFGRRYIAVSVEASAARRFVTLAGLLALEPNRPVEETATLASLRAIERFVSW